MARAVIFDVGGVLLVPDRSLIAAVLSAASVDFDHARFDAAHYHAIFEVDASTSGDFGPKYRAGYLRCLEVPDDQLDRAIEALDQLMSSPAIDIWSTLVTGARESLQLLAAAGIPLAIVSNADGTVEASLMSKGLCQVGPGAHPSVAAIVDSAVVGFSKPDPRIFEPALAALGVDPSEVTYVGDSELVDVQAARNAGVSALHFDPYSLCRRPSEHAHVSSLQELCALLA